MRHEEAIAGPATWKNEDLDALAKLAASGEYKVPIDRTFAIEQMVEAHTYIDSGRKRGNVIVRWSRGD